MTALAGLALEAQGTLSLDDTIVRGGSTLRHALQNTSGIADDEDLLFLDGVTDDAVTELAQHLSVALAAPTLFEPGTHCRYSNSGFRLAADRYEHATGNSFEVVMMHTLFAPLGLLNTHVVPTSTELLPGRSSGYDVGPRGATLRHLFARETSGDGAVVSTVNDMLRWAEALRTDTLPVAGARRVLTERPLLERGSTSGYGLGLCVVDHRGRPMWAHSGRAGAEVAELAILPEEELVVVLFANRGDVDTRRIVRAIVDGALGVEPTLPAQGRDHVLVTEDRRMAVRVRMAGDECAVTLAGDETPMRHCHNGWIDAEGYSAMRFTGVPGSATEPPVLHDPDPLELHPAAPPPPCERASTHFELRELGARLQLHAGRSPCLILGQGRQPGHRITLTSVAPDLWIGRRFAGVRLLRDASGRPEALELNLWGARGLRATRSSA